VLFDFQKHCPSTRDGFSSKENLFYSPFKVNDVRWNFEKFLVSQNGKPIKRYDPTTHPNDIEADIVRLLSPNNDHITQQSQQQSNVTCL
jgi:glutathione peroxidase